MLKLGLVGLEVAEDGVDDLVQVAAGAAEGTTLSLTAGSPGDGPQVPAERYLRTVPGSGERPRTATGSEQGGLLCVLLPLRRGQRAMAAVDALLSNACTRSFWPTTQTATTRMARPWSALQHAREEGRRANLADGGYVFCDELGRPGSPEWLSDRFEAKQADFDGARAITFHGQRHTSATTALARGTPVHVVSARLGHSSVSVTYDIHAHAIPGQDDDAATVIGDAIWGTAATGTESRS